MAVQCHPVWQYHTLSGCTTSRPVHDVPCSPPLPRIAVLYALHSLRAWIFTPHPPTHTHTLRSSMFGAAHLATLLPQTRPHTLQSSMFGAAHLADRVEAFAEELLSTILPDKCSGGGDALAPADDPDEPSLGPSEFTRAVEELAKSKLEKAKTLGELMGRYWSEVVWDLRVFRRQELEVALLRSITPEELMGFAQQVGGGQGRQEGGIV